MNDYEATISARRALLKHAGGMGLVFGAYLLAKYGIYMGTWSYFFLFWISLVMSLLVPFVLFQLVKRYRAIFPRQAAFPFSLAWAYGVIVYVLGSLLVMPLEYYFSVYQLPNLLPAIESSLREALPDGGSYVDKMMESLSNGTRFSFLGQLSVDILWGGVISLIVAPFAKRSAK